MDNNLNRENKDFRDSDVDALTERINDILSSDNCFLDMFNSPKLKFNFKGFVFQWNDSLQCFEAYFQICLGGFRGYEMLYELRFLGYVYLNSNRIIALLQLRYNYFCDAFYTKINDDNKLTYIEIQRKLKSCKFPIEIQSIIRSTPKGSE